MHCPAEEDEQHTVAVFELADHEAEPPQAEPADGEAVPVPVLADQPHLVELKRRKLIAIHLLGRRYAIR